ncbi:MAG: hypothetical protein JNL28_03725 [Planctomycetes bacterium]|nr:hypothetical protein [Planctomycetota bacterium]
MSLTDTPTTLRSSQEVNTVPTSYSTTRPQFAGSSSSSPTLRGTYDGSNGDTTLTFRASTGGIVGLTPISIQVRDSQNTLIQTVNVGIGQAGTFFTLNNGLQFSLSSGSVAINDSFQVNVSASVGSAVRIDKPFNGTNDNTPNFEPGTVVQAGTFQVNGVSIAVAANDTVAGVISKITASAAGVTASFDAAGERVLLTQKTSGPAAGIAVSNDTSGFLRATKLDTAVAQLGTLDQRRQPLSSVAAFSGIQSGTFSINGHAFNLDAANDSLVDVLTRIGAANLGVTATFASGRVLLRGPSNAALILDDGNTGLFSGLGLETGVHQGGRRSGRRYFANESEFRERLRSFVEAYAAVFGEKLNGYGGATVSSLRGEFDRITAGAFTRGLGLSGSGTLRTELGLHLVANSDGVRRLKLDPGELDSALRQNTDDLVKLLYAPSGAGGEEGLLQRLGMRVERALDSVSALLGSGGGTGLILDVLA